MLLGNPKSRGTHRWLEGGAWPLCAGCAQHSGERRQLRGVVGPAAPHQRVCAPPHSLPTGGGVWGAWAGGELPPLRPLP